jgi:hypothetical protein
MEPQSIFGLARDKPFPRTATRPFRGSELAGGRSPSLAPTCYEEPVTPTGARIIETIRRTANLRRRRFCLHSVRSCL